MEPEEGGVISFLSQVAAWFGEPGRWWGPDGILPRSLEHLWLAVLSTGIALLVALPPALLLAHRRRGAFLANAVVNVGRAIPSFGVLVVAGLIFIERGVSLRFWPIVVALILLALPPIFTNAYTGVAGVPSDVLEAALGMGLTGRQLLWSIELPVGAPLVIAGVRIAFVQVLATVPLGAILADGGGLGQYIVRGFAQGMGGRVEVFCGALLVAVLTLGADLALGTGERLLLPAGVRRLTRRSPRSAS